MFTVEFTQTTPSFVVKYTDNNNCTVALVANGNFKLDVDNRTLLVIITYITIPATNSYLLGKFISDVMSYMGKHFSTRVFFRLPMFDNQLDVSKLQVKDPPAYAMVIRIADLYYDDSNTIMYDQEKYILTTNKQTILNYSQQLAELLNANAYWLTHLNSEHIKERINSSERVVMVLDKTNDIPCGFGRLSMMTAGPELNETMGYVNDVVVESRHHGKGLGWTINNYLMGIEKEEINGILCLLCATKGTGAISAPKLYKKIGYRCISELCHRIAIFVDEEHIGHI